MDNNINETYLRENTTIHIVTPKDISQENKNKIIKEYQDIIWRILQKCKKK